METKKMEMFNKIYDRLYDEGYSFPQLAKVGYDLLEVNKGAAALAKDLLIARGDFISSDREMTAFVFLYIVSITGEDIWEKLF